MTDVEVRLAVLRIAVDAVGHPDKLRTAREFYEWVTESVRAAKKEPAEGTVEPIDTPFLQLGKKKK